MNPYSLSPIELCRSVGNRARELRLAHGLRQADLAEAAGVALSTLKRFEQSGEAGFETVTRIAFALGAEQGVAQLFPPRDARSLDDILSSNRKRLRARKKR